MKRVVLSVAAVALSAGMAQAADLIMQAPVIDNIVYASEVPPELYFSVEALALWRSSTDTVLWEDFDSSELISTRDIAGLGMGFGARFAVGGPIADEFGWQIAGLWAGPFSSEGNSIGTSDDLLNPIYSDPPTTGNYTFLNADDAFAMAFTESSSVGGLEASATFDMGEFRFLLGPRWIRYQASLGTVVYLDDDDFDGITDNIDRVDISSTNNLIGVQVGVEGMFPLFDDVSIGGRAAVGLYANHATLDRSYSADNGAAASPFTTASVSDSSSATGFAQSVELSPKVALAVTPNIDVSLGAMLLFLNGVDEPGTHLAGIGEDDGDDTALAADTPSFGNGVHFAGITLGVHGRF